MVTDVPSAEAGSVRLFLPRLNGSLNRLARLKMLTPLVFLALLSAGCSTEAGSSLEQTTRSVPGLASARDVGRGPRFRPRPTGALAARARPVDGMRCLPPRRVVAEAHIEVFAAGHVVVIPAGIGFAPPLSRRGAYVHGERCGYQVRTIAPTGILLMAAGRPLTLGRLFDLWGEPLSHRTVVGFSAAKGAEVSVFIDGSRWRGDPSSAPIAPSAQITIEVGPRVTPRGRYTFPPLRSAAAAR